MSPSDTYIIFELESAAYALRSSVVHHIEMLEHITPVPNAAAAVDGVVFSRGQVIPAINLRTRFRLPPQGATPRTRLIFVQLQSRVVALIVDSAREFQRIPADTIQPVQKTLVGIEGSYVEGMATVKNRSILIINMGAILTIEEITPPALATVSNAPLA